MKNDTLLVFKELFAEKCRWRNYENIQLPAPKGYVRKTGLFDTFWELHSGELWGFPGKLIVDLLGLVTIFLSVTGLLHFFFPKMIKEKKERKTGATCFGKKEKPALAQCGGIYFRYFPADKYFFGNASAPSLADCHCQQKGRYYSRHASRQSKPMV